ncbi:MAG TPA: methyltransferase domain-containing protein [Candidatus Saccharibacteria bacterium]|nr:methyltransferase domain-containing protein [Candidatus Saccharibacteria bacterium]HRJ91056.1 methyltransferase domain-containing protein [Candidatus Saccharibacteria bacterium]
MTEPSYWERVHTQKYDGKDWTKKPSIFAEEVIKYFPNSGLVLELGAGQGQDSTFFVQKGYSVISSDKEVSIIERADANAHDFFEGSYGPMRFQVVDLEKRFPFGNNHFDIVYAHLSLHYFNIETTQQIFSEIYRVLKPSGVLGFLVNSVNDPEYGTGEQLGDSYFATEGTRKRYFSVESAKEFTKEFKTILCDNKGETYKDREKDVHNLIRYVGQKIV